jgi:hypothetical protein
LKIGEAVFRGVPTSVMDFMPSGVERAIDGIIGLPCFSSCLLTLDYAAHRIEIAKGAITLDMPGAIAYRRDEAMGGAIDIPVRAGGVEIRVHVDTGSPEILLVSEDLRGTIPLLGEPVFAGRARTPMGDADLWAADLDGDLEIGALRITKPRVRIGDLPQIAGRKLGNIGSAALSQARLTVDVANARVRIEPGEAEAPPGTQVVKNDRPYRVGILAVPGQDELLVQSVVPGGAGEKAGLRAGDRIVAIARENGDAIPLMEAMKAFGSPEPVRVTFLRDTERIVATLQPLPAGK